jgi:transposase
MNSKVRFVGLDVHKETIVIAVAESEGGEARVLKSMLHDAVKLKKELAALARGGWTLQVCYEAGPTGYGLQRVLTEAKISCVVVAPSLVPKKAGSRVKTDRRDAAQLAHFLRSGDLTAVWVPDEETEALRDLERARDDAKNAERVARHQLDKFLLRHGRIWSGKTRWTRAHRQWVRQQEFPQEATNRVLRDYLKAVEDAQERVGRLTDDIAELVEQTALAPLIQALQALRGISLVSAVVIAAEIGDLRRFKTARQFMAFLGLVPSEHSSGQSTHRGPLTRTGNAHVRWIMVEASWHYQHPPALSDAIRRRQQGVAEGVRNIAWKAQKRLYSRLHYLRSTRLATNKAIVAVARELAGFVWAIGQEEQLVLKSA